MPPPHDYRQELIDLVIGLEWVSHHIGKVTLTATKRGWEAQIGNRARAGETWFEAITLPGVMRQVVERHYHPRG